MTSTYINVVVYISDFSDLTYLISQISEPSDIWFQSEINDFADLSDIWDHWFLRSLIFVTSLWSLRSHQGNCKQKLTIHIEWSRKICKMLSFIVLIIIHIWFGNSWVKSSGVSIITSLYNFLGSHTNQRIFHMN